MKLTLSMFALNGIGVGAYAFGHPAPDGAAIGYGIASMVWGMGLVLSELAFQQRMKVIEHHLRQVQQDPNAVAEALKMVEEARSPAPREGVDLW